MVDKRRSKKKVVKATKPIEIKATDLTPAHYNPRSMDDISLKGLKASMEKFDDISGITWNKTTGNIVTGHHRWEYLVEKYGMDEVTFEHLSGDKYLIKGDGEDTGYIMRQVDWDESKEKAANVTANSHKIEGQFTADLTDLLAEIKGDLDDGVFSDLRLDDLEFEMGYLSTDDSKSASDSDWDSDIGAIKKVDEDDQQMYANITITVKVENKEEIFETVKEALNGKEFDIR